MITKNNKKLIIIFSSFLLLLTAFFLVGCRKKQVTMDNIKQSYDKIKNKLDTTKLVIKDNALEKLENFTDQVLYIPETVKAIKQNAITNAPSIKLIYLASSVTKLERLAINNVTSLEGIYFDGDKELAADSIFNNGELKQVYFNQTKLQLPKLNNKFHNPFISNSNLTEFKVLGDSTNLKYSDNCLTVLDGSDKILLTLTKGFGGTLDDSINYIAVGVDGLNIHTPSEIKLPRNLKTVYSETFTGFTSLKIITLPVSATYESGFISNSPLITIIGQGSSEKFVVKENVLINTDSKTAVLLSKQSKVNSDNITVIGSFSASGNNEITLSDVKTWIAENNIKGLASYAFANTYLKGEISLQQPNLVAIGKGIFKGVAASSLVVLPLTITDSIDAEYNLR